MKKNGKNVFDLIKQMNETHHTLLTISCPYIYGTNINSMDVMRYAANDVPECFIELCVHDTHTIPFPVTGYSNTCAHTNAETSPKHFIWTERKKEREKIRLFSLLRLLLRHTFVRCFCYCVYVYHDTCIWILIEIIHVSERFVSNRKIPCTYTISSVSV